MVNRTCAVGVLVALCGCAAPPFETDGAVALYGTAREALEVVRGGIGAMPIAIAPADELMVAGNCGADVTQVLVRNGVSGWVRSSALPEDRCAHGAEVAARSRPSLPRSL